MKRVRALRKWKWLATAACLFISAVWLWSGFQCLKIAQRRDSGAMITHGVFTWVRAEVDKRQALGISPAPDDDDTPVLMFSKFHKVPEYRWSRPVYHSIGAYQHELIIPLWLPILLMLIPTLYLWWKGRDVFTAGHCERCGYDLTGNVSGRCPECGNVIQVS